MQEEWQNSMETRPTTMDLEREVDGQWDAQEIQKPRGNEKSSGKSGVAVCILIVTSGDVWWPADGP